MRVNHTPGMIAVKMCFIGTTHQLSMGDTRQKYICKTTTNKWSLKTPESAHLFYNRLEK